MADGYRSYVVRIRRLPDALGTPRLEVEDLLGGRRGTVSGGSAEALGDRLEAIVTTTAARRTARVRVIEPEADR